MKIPRLGKGGSSDSKSINNTGLVLVSLSGPAEVASGIEPYGLNDIFVTWPQLTPHAPASLILRFAHGLGKKPEKVFGLGRVIKFDATHIYCRWHRAYDVGYDVGEDLGSYGASALVRQ